MNKGLPSQKQAKNIDYLTTLLEFFDFPKEMLLNILIDLEDDIDDRKFHK